jgi:hypothetical protein
MKPGFNQKFSKHSVFRPFIRAVHSPKEPNPAHALPIIDSSSCPIVILDGIACGL